MQQHGPNAFSGPVRGTPGWWQELGRLSEPAKPPKKKRARKKPAPADPAQSPRVDRIRHELVDRVRREIAAGTYETQEKWEAALDRLLECLDSD